MDEYKKGRKCFNYKVSKEYKHKRILVSTQRYKDGGGTDKSVLDMTDSLRHQKIGLKKSEYRDFQGIFVVKLRAQKVDNYFFNTKLPLNENGNDLDKQLSYVNYKKIVRKLHDTGLKNSYHTSADVSMIGYGCGVSMYSQFFVKYLDLYQMLPRPHLISFYGGPGYKVLKKIGCWNWQIEQKHLSGNVLNPG